MLKWLGIGLMICGSTAVGVVMSRELEQRIILLQELRKVMSMLEGEIHYANATLSEAFYHVARRSKQPFSGFLEHMAERMDGLSGGTIQEIFQMYVDQDLKNTALLTSDLEQLKRLGEQLGYLDVKMQQKAIQLYTEQLQETCAQAAGVYQSKSKICRYLGIMGGLFLAILFI